MTNGFFRGLAYPLRGLGYLARHRELWKYAAGAFAVNVLVFTALAVLFALYWGDLVDLLTPDSTPAWLQAVVGCILAIVVVGIFLFLFTIVGNIIAGPFLDAMTERMLLGLGEPPLPSRGFWNALGRSVVNQLLKLLFFGGFQVALLVLLVTPLGFAHPVLAGLLTVLFLAFEYLDYPLDVKRMPVSKRYGYLFRNLGPSLGFGTVCLGVMFVPFLGYFTLPASVCGATLLVHDLERARGGSPAPPPPDPARQ